MELKLEGCSNAGWSLTEFRKEQILKLYGWVENNKGRRKTYKQIQEEIEATCEGLDSSKVRMIVPFLRKMGYIQSGGFEQKNALINLNDFFTQQGKAYIEYLKLSKKTSVLERKDINNKLSEIDTLFNIMNMINLVLNGEEVYIDCINFLKEYETMDKNEFFIMTTIRKEYLGNEYTRELKRVITEYRNNKFNKIEITKHANSYGYVKKFLIETNLLFEYNGNLKLNDKYSYILDGIK